MNVGVCYAEADRQTWLRLEVPDDSTVQQAIELSGLLNQYPQIDLGKQKAPNAKGFDDYRKVLEMKDVDVCLIATPDHWHSQIAIEALNAGKDVYVEKPLTLTIEEGPKVVKAARVNERVCQVGMQQRSGKHYIQARDEYIKPGKLGKITLARTWWHGNTYHLRRAPASLQTLPSNLDWARFLGPLKKIIVAEENYTGQYAHFLKGKFGIHPLEIHKCDGIPFTSEELHAAIKEVL